MKSRTRPTRGIPRSLAALAWIIAILTSATAAWAGNDAQVPIALDVGKALRAAGLDAAGPRAVVVAVAIENPFAAGAWQTGLAAGPDTMRQGSLGLTPEKAVADYAPGESLRLKPGTSDPKGVSVEACAGGKCRPLAVETVAANRYRIAVHGLNFVLDVHGELCEANARQCEIDVPSWSLAQRGARGDGSAAFFPRVLAVVQLDGKVVLIDAEQGAVVFDLRLPGEEVASSFGRLVEAQFYRQGALLLRFTQGAMLLDFAQDLVLLANGNGELWLLDRGLGAASRGDAGVFNAVGDEGASTKSLAKLLLLTPDAVLTDQGMTRFRLSASRGFVRQSYAESDGTWKEAHSLAGGGEIAVLSVGNDGAAAVLGARMDDARPSPLKGATAVKADRRGSGEFRLAQENIYIRRGDGWQLPESQDQTGASIIPGTRRREKLLGATGTIYAQRVVTGGADCDWTRHRLTRRGTRAAVAYLEDGGLRASCDAPVEFNAANAEGVEAAVLWEKGTNVRIYLFIPGA
jgi:hypothetical protein